MSKEEEFLNRSQELLSSLQTNEKIQKYQHFLNNLIAKNINIEISDEIRKIIPNLACIKSGLLIPILSKIISGLSPMHFVPDLNLETALNQNPHPPSSSRSQSSKRNKMSARACKSTRTTKIFDSNHLNIAPRKKKPISARSEPTKNNRKLTTKKENSILNQFKVTDLKFEQRPSARVITRPLNRKNVDKIYNTPLSLETNEIEVVPFLYTKYQSDYFVCKKEKETDYNMKIIPPEYPCHLIGPNFSLLSARTVVTIDDTNHSTAISLSRFLKLKNKEIIVSGMKFRQQRGFHLFYKWRERTLSKRFSRITSIYNEKNNVIMPGYSPLQDQIRDKILDSLENISLCGPEFDASFEDVEFDELKLVSKQFIDETREKIIAIKDWSDHIIAELFKQIRAAQLLMKLNFEELHSLNALPPSLQQYSSDLRWKIPSIYRQKLREQQLAKERKLSCDRTKFITHFFARIRSLYAGILLLKCKEILISFLNRFQLELPRKRRTHRLVAISDGNQISIIPPMNQFQQWIQDTSSKLKEIFLDDNCFPSPEILTDINPNYECPLLNMIEVLERFKDLKDARKKSIESITNTYHYFESALEKHCKFSKNLEMLLEKGSQFHDFEKIGEVSTIVNQFVVFKQELTEWPKNLYHRIKGGDTATDFILDLRPATEIITERLNKGCQMFKDHILQYINGELFEEIQIKFTTSKNHHITKQKCTIIEGKILLFAMLCDKLFDAWPELQGDLKASFDTVSKMYRDLETQTTHIHSDVIIQFNKVAEKFGILGVMVPEDDEYTEYEEEEVFEEEEDGD